MITKCDNTLRNVSGTLFPGTDYQSACSGYEIHMGVTRGAALERPALLIGGQRPDGALSADGRIFATYVHGAFDRPEAGAALLRWAGLDAARGTDLDRLREASLDRLADCIEREVDVSRLLSALVAA